MYSSSILMLAMIVTGVLLLIALALGSRCYGSLRHLTWRWNLLFIVAALGFLAFYSVQTYQQQVSRRTLQVEQELLHQAREQIRHRASFVRALILDEKRRARQQLKEDLHNTVMQAVAVAEALIERYHERLTAPEMTELVVETLRPLRDKNGRGYMFITRLDGTELLFADRPEMEGSNMLDMQDQDGVFYVREMIRLSRQHGKGFVSYRIICPGVAGCQHKKIAYIHYVPELDAFVGTGEYVESFEAELRQKIVDKLARLVEDGPLTIFGSTYTGISLFGPGKGANVLDIQDQNGIFVVQELIRTAKQGGGFVRYQMPSALGGGVYEKISYCLPLETWDSYIGAGIDLGFIEHNIAQERQEMFAAMRQQIIQGAVFILLFGTLLWVVSQRLSRSIKRNVRNLNHAFEGVSADGRAISLDEVQFDEFIAIGEAANRMLEQLHMAETERDETCLKFHTALDRAPLLVALINPQRRILFCNSMWKQVLPNADNSAPLNEDWFSPESWLRLENVIAEMSLGKSDKERFDATISTGNKKKYYYDLSVAAIRSSNNEVESILIMARDITERRQAEEKLAWLAHFDALTGLSNRHYAKEHLDHLLTNAAATENCWLLMFDINRFKRINEIYGHALADRVLVEFAKRLQSVKPQPKLAARLSGNEFILVLKLEGIEDIAHIVQRVKEQLCAPMHFGRIRQILDVRISAVKCSQVESFSELVHRADIALIEAKEHPCAQGFMCYDARLDKIYQENLVLEKALRLALQNPEQFKLEFQPIWSVKERTLQGFETLVRWHHPTFGLIPPARFIPLAEKRAMIVPLGRIIFNHACETLAQWLQQYPELKKQNIRLSVNMAPQQFITQNFIEEINSTLQRWQLPPELLCFEITETSLMQEPELAIQRIRALKDMGIFISIDDFGTGYSSLSYLQQFDVDVIKLDRSLVINIAETHSAQRIIDAVVRLGHDLDLIIVAEGVETLEQLQALHDLDCDAVQGFLTGKPVVEEVARTWLKDPKQFPLTRID